ncbi:MFS transporter [Cohnella luojiensis]|nr:MFS transporter [Cohnella luojiensis]
MNAFAASLLTSIPVLCMGFLSPLSIRLGKHIGFERGIIQIYQKANFFIL